MVWRITDRATFAALRSSRYRAGAGPVRVVYVPAAAGAPRVAYAVGRQAGGAVVRNRIRRRLRAVVARLDGLAPGAYLLTAGSVVAVMPFDELTAVVGRALERVAP